MIVREKQILRAAMRRALVGGGDYSNASAALARHLRGTAEWQAARVVYGFVPLPTEPDWRTDDLEKVIAFPRCEGRRIRFIVGGVLRCGPHAALEPGGGEVAPPPDLVIVPGLAFDPSGGRLGRGGGYYDRWIEGNPGLPRIGVCFALQVVEKVPREDHDARVGKVVTEEGVV